MSYTLAASRSFGVDDQLWFAAASGDTNPIHVDTEEARRLLAGGVIVHGIHLLLWAIECHCASGGNCPTAIAATFHAPLLTDTLVTLEGHEDPDRRVRLTAWHGRTTAATILLSMAGSRNPGEPPTGRPESGQPRDPTPDALADAHGRIPVSAASEDLAAFPCAIATLGPLPVAALMTLSRLVGMECPGRHSLFVGLTLTLEPELTEADIAWRVGRPPRPPAPLQLSVAGAGLSGSLSALVRPAPIRQPDMAMVNSAVLTLLGADALAGHTALVIGGSRGLGELTAKIIAAAGGVPIVTYHKGASDARRVVEDIVSVGKCAEIVDFDADDSDACLSLLRRCPARPSHLYYFAAPRISAPRSGPFDPSLSRSFNRIFVESFATLVTSAEAPLRVFYPSTVFIDEIPRDQPEYIAAKAAGEMLCTWLGHHMPQLSFVVRRLPRLPTDQTSGLIRRAVADPLPILVDVIRAMHCSKGNSSDPG